jgi:hypothetical protein
MRVSAGRSSPTADSHEDLAPPPHVAIQTAEEKSLGTKVYTK